MNLRQEVRE